MTTCKQCQPKAAQCANMLIACTSCVSHKGWATSAFVQDRSTPCVGNTKHPANRRIAEYCKSKTRHALAATLSAKVRHCKTTMLDSNNKLHLKG